MDNKAVCVFIASLKEISAWRITNLGISSYDSSAQLDMSTSTLILSGSEFFSANCLVLKCWVTVQPCLVTGTGITKINSFLLLKINCSEPMIQIYKFSISMQCMLQILLLCNDHHWYVEQCWNTVFISYDPDILKFYDLVRILPFRFWISPNLIIWGRCPLSIRVPADFLVILSSTVRLLFCLHISLEISIFLSIVSFYWRLLSKYFVLYILWFLHPTWSHYSSLTITFQDLTETQCDGQYSIQSPDIERCYNIQT